MSRINSPKGEKVVELWRGAKTWRLVPALPSRNWLWLSGLPWGGSRYVASSFPLSTRFLLSQYCSVLPRGCSPFQGRAWRLQDTRSGLRGYSAGYIILPLVPRVPGGLCTCAPLPRSIHGTRRMTLVRKVAPSNPIVASAIFEVLDIAEHAHFPPLFPAPRLFPWWCFMSRPTNW